VSALPFDPVKMSAGIVRKMTGAQTDYCDDPLLPIYRVRTYRDGNQWGTTTMLDVLGCNENCAHCYVPEELLRAQIHSSLVQKRFSELPRALRESIPQEADAIYDYVTQRIKRGHRTKLIELNGGEPTLYRGGIRQLALRAKEDHIRLGVKTNGLLIATHPEYLDAFQGLEDTMEFFVSIKGTTSEEFERFAGVHGTHFNTPFETYRQLIEHKFIVYLGVTLDTIANPEELKNERNALTRLHARLMSIHPDAIRLIT
jgi:uncharacterized Fe-S cluster-containing radical SAM superfamily protein